MNMEYDEKKLSDELVRKHAYPPEDVEFMLEDIRGMQQPLRAAFADWRSSEVAPTLEIEGYSFNLLRDLFGMNPFAAFLTRDSLLTNPEQAKKTLSRGVDRIVHTTVKRWEH